MTIPITKLNDLEYEAADPKTKGRWLVRSNLPLSDLGVIYAMADSLSRDNSRPAEGVTRTVEFTIKVAEDGEEMSAFQKAFLSLSLESEK